MMNSNRKMMCTVVALLTLASSAMAQETVEGSISGEYERRSYKDARPFSHADLLEFDVAGIRPGMSQAEVEEKLRSDGWTGRFGKFDGSRLIMGSELTVENRAAGFAKPSSNQTLFVFRYKDMDGTLRAYGVKLEQKFDEPEDVTSWVKALGKRYGDPSTLRWDTTQDDVYSATMIWRTRPSVVKELYNISCVREPVARINDGCPTDRDARIRERANFMLSTQESSMFASISKERGITVDLSGRAAYAEAVASELVDKEDELLGNRLKGEKKEVDF